MTIKFWKNFREKNNFPSKKTQLFIVFTCFIKTCRGRHHSDLLVWLTAWWTNQRNIFHTPAFDQPPLLLAHSVELFEIESPIEIVVIVSDRLTESLWHFLTLVWSFSNQRAKFRAIQKSIVVSVILRVEKCFLSGSINQ